MRLEAQKRLISELKAGAQDKADGAEELEKRLQAQTNLIDALQKDQESLRRERLDAKENERMHASLQTSLEERDSQLAELRTKLVELQQAQESKSEFQAEVEELRSTIAGDKEEIQKLQGELREMKDDQSKSEHEEEDNYSLQVELEQGREELDSLHQELERLQPMEARLRERDDSIAKLVQAIKKNEKTIDGLRSYIEEWRIKYNSLEEQFLVTDPTVPCLPALPDTGKYQAVDEAPTGEPTAEHVEEPIEEEQQTPEESKAAASSGPRPAYTYVKD